MKKNENDGSPVTGMATLADTPGMGNVIMPTETTPGSGDVFGGVMSFKSWKGSKRKKNKRRKRY